MLFEMCEKLHLCGMGKIVLVKRGLSLSLVLAFCLFSVSGMFHKLEITGGFLGGGIF